MTDRRAFIGGVAGGLLASPLVTFAQQHTKLPRIGILGSTYGTAWDAFRLGLRELGYVEGRNVTMEWRWAEGKPDRFPELATELVELKVDLIVTSSTQAALAAKQATSSIPIVMTISSYPEKMGLAESLAHPGGNITGFSNIAPELIGKRLELLKAIAPKVSRVAVLWNPASRIEPYGFREVLAGASVVGVEIQSVEVRTPDDYPAAFATVTASRADALHAFGNPVNFKHLQLIADFALRNLLPSSYEERAFVEAGGLLSYAPSFIDLYQRAGSYVDKILKGAKPGDLPIQQPTKFEFVINSKTAKALGLTIARSLLVRADDVIQ
ncbi:MAG: ABC transporter substrate-binding protein [Variovorax sp.]|nr:MAG: ABC transporter substrate-binding protein [Variovorax sp.]